MRIKFQGIENEKAALEAVKRNGYALQYVKDQTEAVCLEAVKRNGDALQYVVIRAIFDTIVRSLGI